MTDKNKLILITGNDNFFGQTRKPWVSMDVGKLQRAIAERGLGVQKYCFHELMNSDKKITDAIIFYTFSQKLNRRNYIQDLIRYLDDGSNLIIPSRELLECHENKGYQELYKKKIHLPALKSFYFSSVKELDSYELNFPLVLKTTDGSNGEGVHLIHTKNELRTIIDKLERQEPLTLLDLVRRKYFRKQKHYPLYPDYSNRTDYYQYRDYILKEKNFILQEFIPDLNYDYRVLVLFDKYFAMKRLTHSRDFRASGTKIFEFNRDFPMKLFDYARSVYQKFDAPFLSLDICEHKDDYFLFEFQALHFGISAVLRSTGYHQFINDKWQFIEEKSQGIETELATALVNYIHTKKFS